MTDTLAKKKEVVPELKAAYKAAKERAAEAKAALGHIDKLQQLKHELAWAFVAEIEDDVSRGAELVDKAKKKQQKIEAAITEHKVSSTRRPING